MKNFYEQQEESFHTEKKKRNKKLLLVIISFLLLLFLISIIPLAYGFYTTKSFNVFQSMYFLNTNTPVGAGSYIITQGKFTLFVSDIFFGGFKPLIYIASGDNFVKAFQFSDSLSYADSHNLFNDTKITFNATDKGFVQTYFIEDSALLKKSVTTNGNNLRFDFDFGNATKKFNLVFYTDDKMSVKGDSLKIEKGLCDILFRISTSAESVQTTSNTLELYSDGKKNVSLTLEFLHDNCADKKVSDKLPVEMGINPMYLLYPLITLLLISLSWWYYGH